MIGNVKYLYFDISLFKYFESDDQDFDAQKFVFNELTYYAQKVDIGQGRSAGEYLETSISRLTEQRVRELFNYVLGSDYMEKLYIEFPHVGSSRPLQLIHFFMFCNLHRSLSEYISSHMAELTEEDSFQILYALILHPKSLLQTSKVRIAWKCCQRRGSGQNCRLIRSLRQTKTYRLAFQISLFYIICKLEARGCNRFGRNFAKRKCLLCDIRIYYISEAAPQSADPALKIIIESQRNIFVK